MDVCRVRDKEKGKVHPDALTEKDCKPIGNHLRLKIVLTEVAQRLQALPSSSSCAGRAQVTRS